MKVAVTHLDRKGGVVYRPRLKEVEVSFPDESVVADIETFLTTRRVFRIPQSDRIDDFEEQLLLPTDNKQNMMLALSEMFGAIDVWVDWNTFAA